MSPRAHCLLAALSTVLSCRASHCPAICQCSKDALQCSRDTQLASGAPPVQDLRFFHLALKAVPTHAFKELINVTHIEVSYSVSVTVIKRHAFLSLYYVTEIVMLAIKNLRVIEKGAFTDLPSLEYLRICNTGVMHIPDFSSISSLASNMILEITENPRIDIIAPNSFQGMTKEYIRMDLSRNGLKEIKSHAFNGSRLSTLILRGNKYLSMIHEDAFEGASGPSSLDVSFTAISSLPSKGLNEVMFLQASSAPALKSLPPLESLPVVIDAELTYSSHCCALETWQREQRDNDDKNYSKRCDLIDVDIIEPTADYEINIHELLLDYPELGVGCRNSPPLKCTPQPDAFNPCEDLLGFSFLRSLTWIISVSAVTGNLAVLVFLLFCRRKLTISTFLMCNLAFADLCMGLYLLFIAVEDYQSRHEYYNHATDWQTGPGCGTAGFLTVFASELSVYTLTVISLERWHTITNAMHVNKRLQMPHVIAMMGAGWGASLVVALLPLVGVSSYSKVSICLPMDIDSSGSQVYVVSVLLLNVVAFLVICCCYIGIYRSVRNLEYHGDATIAKRMAVLIFTDFLCMAPISFFAISAALGLPLITLSHSKILLILVFPINSLCNPFLYTILTQAFQKEVCQLFRHCGQWLQRRH